MTAVNQDFDTFYQGEIKSQAFAVVDSTGAAKDITSTVFTFLMAASPATVHLVTKTSISGITVTSALGGLLTIDFLAVDTATLPIVPGGYFYELWAYESSYNIVIATGRIPIEGKPS